MSKSHKKQDEPYALVYEEVIFFSGSFLIGAVLGSFFVSGFSNTLWIAEWLERLLSWKGYLLIHGSLTTVIFIGKFLPKGQMIVPFAVAIEGFFLSGLITAYVQAYGYKGYGPALVAWMLPGLMTVLIQFLIGCRAGSGWSNKRRARRQKGFGRGQLVRAYVFSGLAVCAVLILISWLQSGYLAKWTAAWLQRLV